MMLPQFTHYALFNLSLAVHHSMAVDISFTGTEEEEEEEEEEGEEETDRQTHVLQY